MQNYSIFNLLKHAFTGHVGWNRAFGGTPLRKHYDVVIVGGGGHGLATAYYLAKNHGISNVAVLERGYLGGGNTGRNTTMIRSDYLLPQNSDFKEFSLQLWEGLSAELNFNVMVSQRGYIDLACSEGDLEAMAERANSVRLRGIDCEILDVPALKKICPELDVRPDTRYPIHGAFYQARGGIARHDAVAWGYARGAHNLGVDIFENCGVDDFIIHNNRVGGVKTAQGDVLAGQVLVAVAGSSGRMAAKAGFSLPIETVPALAMVSESLKAGDQPGRSTSIWVGRSSTSPTRVSWSWGGTLNHITATSSGVDSIVLKMCSRGGHPVSLFEPGQAHANLGRNRRCFHGQQPDSGPNAG